MLKQLSEPEIRLELESTLPDLLPQEKLDEYCINRKQEQNLRKLLIGLERLLPTHEHIFDMRDYAHDKDGAWEKTKNATVLHPCGTPACAVGLAPSCGIEIQPEEGWTSFSYSKFGGYNYPESDFEYKRINDFMFSSFWGVGNNQMREAIARIKLVLTGNAPSEFDFTETYT